MNHQSTQRSDIGEASTSPTLVYSKLGHYQTTKVKREIMHGEDEEGWNSISNVEVEGVSQPEPQLCNQVSCFSDSGNVNASVYGQCRDILPVTKQGIRRMKTFHIRYLRVILEITQ